jgi:Fic family protein
MGSQMSHRKTGVYEQTIVGGEEVKAFVPEPLPPRNPPLAVDTTLVLAAEQAVARLALSASMLPSIDWFIYAFVRKEAVLTSQIEGTQATLMDLLNFEADSTSTPTADVEEVCNYVDALLFARSEITKPRGLPISVRLLNAAHAILMRGVRGSKKQPGDIRTSQNWIGGSRPGKAAFVPPPHLKLSNLLTELEKYIHSSDKLPPIVRAGLVHVQFETIHPYLDGNGRIGRLLITLLFEHWGLLPQPLLYISLYLKQNQDEYYHRLAAVRKTGDWEGWTNFFLTAVIETANEAIAMISNLFSLVTQDRARVLAHGTMSVAAIRLFEQLPKHPIITAAAVIKLLETSKPTAGRAIETLVEVGVLVETTGKKRDRTYIYKNYLDCLN